MILIDRSCRNFAFFQDEIIHANDPESFHSKICAELFLAKEIRSIPEEMKKNDRIYLWKNLEIITQKNGKLMEIRKNGKIVLKVFDLISRKSACKIDLSRMEVKFSDGSKLLLD
jgi:hypothetical protein